MPGNRKLKIAFRALLFVVCIAGLSWWGYISFTLVPFEAVSFNDKKEPVAAEVPGDFYTNLHVVLDGCHITYKLDILNHPLIPIKVARDKELMRDLTEKGQDLVWLYAHTKEKPSSFPCGGEGYVGAVFGKEISSIIGGDSTTGIDLTCDEVALAEQILHKEIETTGGLHARRIDYEFPSYYRQYMGYRNVRGEVMVYIKLVLKGAATISEIQNDLDGVKDGGSARWQAEVNLNQKMVEYVTVNGYAVLYQNHF